MHRDNTLTRLHAAAEGGDVDTVVNMIEGGVNCDVVDDCGQTVLHIAAFTNQVSVLKLFLGSYINPFVFALITQLCSKVFSERVVLQVELIAYLVSIDAKLNVQDNMYVSHIGAMQCVCTPPLWVLRCV